MSNKIDALDPDFRHLAETFLAAAKSAGFDLLVTAGRRTIAEQNALYAQGRTTKGNIVTNAKGGHSPHNFGCAIDIVPLRDGTADWSAPTSTWQAIAYIGKQCGLAWGGDFRSIKDMPHFESPTWRQLQDAWTRGELKVE